MIKRYKTSRFFIILISLLVYSGTAQAAEYYVAPNGNDDNPGTIDRPWKSPSRPRSAVEPGDTVYFRGGDYVITEGKDYVRFSKSGTETAPITYKNYQG